MCVLIGGKKSGSVRRRALCVLDSVEKPRRPSEGTLTVVVWDGIWKLGTCDQSEGCVRGIKIKVVCIVGRIGKWVRKESF